MTSRINLQHTSASHHALHHFVTKPKWLGSAFMSGVQDWVVQFWLSQNPVWHEAHIGVTHRFANRFRHVALTP